MFGLKWRQFLIWWALLVGGIYLGYSYYPEINIDKMDATNCLQQHMQSRFHTQQGREYCYIVDKPLEVKNERYCLRWTGRVE